MVPRSASRPHHTIHTTIDTRNTLRRSTLVLCHTRFSGDDTCLSVYDATVSSGHFATLRGRARLVLFTT